MTAIIESSKVLSAIARHWSRCLASDGPVQLKSERWWQVLQRKAHPVASDQSVGTQGGSGSGSSRDDVKSSDSGNVSLVDSGIIAWGAEQYLEKIVEFTQLLSAIAMATEGHELENGLEKTAGKSDDSVLKKGRGISAEELQDLILEYTALLCACAKYALSLKPANPHKKKAGSRWRTKRKKIEKAYNKHMLEVGKELRSKKSMDNSQDDGFARSSGRDSDISDSINESVTYIRRCTRALFGLAKASRTSKSEDLAEKESGETLLQSVSERLIHRQRLSCEKDRKENHQDPSCTTTVANSESGLVEDPIKEIRSRKEKELKDVSLINSPIMEETVAFIIGEYEEGIAACLQGMTAIVNYNEDPEFVEPISTERKGADLGMCNVNSSTIPSRLQQYAVQIMHCSNVLAAAARTTARLKLNRAQQKMSGRFVSEASPEHKISTPLVCPTIKAMDNELDKVDITKNSSAIVIEQEYDMSLDDYAAAIVGNVGLFQTLAHFMISLRTPINKKGGKKGKEIISDRNSITDALDRYSAHITDCALKLCAIARASGDVALMNAAWQKRSTDADPYMRLLHEALALLFGGFESNGHQVEGT